MMETERLLLRQHTEADFMHIYNLNQNEEVIQYTGNTAFASVDEAKRVLEDLILTQHRLYNTGRWAVIRKSDSIYIGWCGIKTDPENYEIDLGYRFFREEWGKGYATEAAMSCIEYAKTNFKGKVIYGRVDERNLASIMVLEKCGFNFQRDEIQNGVNHHIYIFQC